MFNFIQMEFLKLKRSKIFLLTLGGGILTPLMMFVGLLKTKMDDPTAIVSFQSVFADTNLYFLGLFGIILFSVIVAYLFGREYNEHTLKSVLTVPISKTKYLFGKFSMYLIWLIILAIVNFSAALIFGFIGGADQFTFKIAFEALYHSILGSILLGLTMSPFIFLSIWLKNLVPAMICGAGMCLGNMLVFGQDWSPLFPWIAPYLLSSGDISQYTYGSLTPSLILLATFIVGLAISWIYFAKKDVSL